MSVSKKSEKRSENFLIIVENKYSYTLVGILGLARGSVMAVVLG